MDNKSKYFDSIRIKKPSAKKEEPTKKQCQWKDCERPGTHKAPLGRDHEGQYVHFCVDHVREYNKSYNYFSGLGDDEIAHFQKDALTGHRPTWAMGANRPVHEPHLTGIDPRAAAEARVRSKLRARYGKTAPQGKKLKTLEKKSLEDLSLPHSATADQIKTRYKELVKRHHPDANGGDRSNEERLRQIIQAYKHLKQAGFC